MAASSYSSSLFTFCIIIAVVLIASSAPIVVDGSSVENLSWLPIRSGCRGSVAECMAAEGNLEEFDMDSESNRRILANSKYVSYGALQKNNVPCSKRGASYYSNCQKSGQANPYSRGCSTITRCSR